MEERQGDCVAKADSEKGTGFAGDTPGAVEGVLCRPDRMCPGEGSDNADPAGEEEQASEGEEDGMVFFSHMRGRGRQRRDLEQFDRVRDLEAAPLETPLATQLNQDTAAISPGKHALQVGPGRRP